MLHPFFSGSNEPTNGKTSAVTLTARMFFGLDGHESYVSTSDFLAYGESLKPKEANDLAKLLANMSKGIRMNGNPYVGVDNHGKPYTWHEFIKPRAVAGFKVIHGGGIPALIEDYQETKVNVSFTLDDLIKVARES